MKVPCGPTIFYNTKYLGTFMNIFMNESAAYGYFYTQEQIFTYTQK